MSSQCLMTLRFFIGFLPERPCCQPRTWPCKPDSGWCRSGGQNHNTSFSSLLTNGPDKQECFPQQAFLAWCNVTLQLFGPICKLQRKWSVVNRRPGAIFTTFILFATYKWAQKAWVLNNNRLEKLATNKHARFLGPFVSFGENEVLWIRDQGPYSQHFIFFATYKWAQKAWVLNNTRLEKLASNKHSSLLGQFLSFGENEALSIRDDGPYSQHFIFFVTYEWAQKAGVLNNTMLEKPASNKHSSFWVHL